MNSPVEPSSPGEPTDSIERPPASAPAPRGVIANLGFDIPAALVVFLVALPLCLGIALASGAPPLAGLVTGIVGGVLVALLSGSPLAVSGPAAGLTTIVAAAIISLGYEGYLLAVVLAGGMQVVLGIARAGLVAYYFPSNVIKGMLAAIGIILIIKQFDHALGHDEDYEGNLQLFGEGASGFSDFIGSHVEAVGSHIGHIEPAALLICGLGLLVLVGWTRAHDRLTNFWSPLGLVPAPLIVVLLAVGLNALFAAVLPAWALGGEHLVRLPTGGISALTESLRFPAFSRIGDSAVWSAAATIAAVASIETLLCIEAIDKLDPQKRTTPTNRELMAQGAGNVVAGLLGGLPLTAVIVRGSANIQAGGKTKMSAFLHGLMLLAAIVAVPFLMNYIPLAALAAVLLHVGYKLAHVELFRHMFRQEVGQWLPFIVTVVAIVATDLLKGVGVGMVVAVFFILRANLNHAFFIHERESHAEIDGEHIRLELSENVSFLNRASVNRVLHELPHGSVVEVDGRNSKYIHPDVVELIHEFKDTAYNRRITVRLNNIPDVNRGPGH